MYREQLSNIQFLYSIPMGVEITIFQKLGLQYVVSFSRYLA